jgi:beta-aspartyl-peptidase (threonine type)
LLHERLRELGGSGGVIAIDRAGRIVTQFSTEGMFRGARDSNALRQIDIY